MVRDKVIHALAAIIAVEVIVHRRIFLTDDEIEHLGDALKTALKELRDIESQ